MQQLKQTSLALGLVLLASLTYVLGTSLLFFSSVEQLEVTYLWVLVGFMPLGFVILPHFLANRQNLYARDVQVKFSWQSYLILAVIIFLINHWFIGSSEFFIS